MIEEVWERWHPIENLEQKYELMSLNQNAGKLHFLLEDHYRITVSFQKGLISYWMKDETYSVKRIYDTEIKYGDGFLGFWTFFTISNSSYLKNYFKGIKVSDKIIHFCIITSNDFIDIFATEHPVVKKIT